MPRKKSSAKKKVSRAKARVKKGMSTETRKRKSDEAYDAIGRSGWAGMYEHMAKVNKEFDPERSEYYKERATKAKVKGTVIKAQASRRLRKKVRGSAAKARSRRSKK